MNQKNILTSPRPRGRGKQLLFKATPLPPSRYNTPIIQAPLQRFRAPINRNRDPLLWERAYYPPLSKTSVPLLTCPLLGPLYHKNRKKFRVKREGRRKPKTFGPKYATCPSIFTICDLHTRFRYLSKRIMNILFRIGI